MSTMSLRKLATDFGVRYGMTYAPSNVAAASAVSMSRAFATVMDGLKYAESHEWVKVEDDTATVGISDFAQAELGDVVYVELPETGAEFSQKEAFGVVESVKAASEVFSPVSGTVVEVNDSLVDTPGKVNTGSYSDGWLMKIKMSNPSEVDGLMDSDKYKQEIA